MDKVKRIRAEHERLYQIYKDLPENKLKTLEGLIQNAAFMRITLDDLMETVNKEGAIRENMTGNGFVTVQEHPAQKSYNVMITRYNAVISQLASLTDQLKDRSAKSKMAMLDE